MSGQQIDNILDSLLKIIVNPITVNMFYPYKIINKEPTTGTGIFIKEDNSFIYILTCAHVIENKAKITVMSRYNKERVVAVPVGICFDKDIAIIKVSKNDKNFKYLNKLRIANIDKNVNISQGDIVKAIGYPLAEENVILTSGVFSGFKKNYLQVDTPVNPGNSGGPLVNENLEIVGIVSSKIPNNIATNIAYVIPISHINTIKEILLNNGDEFILHEPKLGMIFMNANDNIYNLMKIKTDYGYYVTKVLATSQFYNIIKPGNLILNIDDNIVDRYGFITNKDKNDNYKLHITDYYSRKILNDVVNITIFDGSNIVTIKEIVKNTNNFNIKSINYPYDKVDYEIFSGMILTNLTIDHIIKASKNISELNDYKITQYLQPEYRDHKILIISSILQGSYVSELDIFDNGEIIKSIDDIELDKANKIEESMLETARRIIINNTTGYVKFTSINNKFIVINMSDALNNEKILSVEHKYNTTNMTKFLISRTEKYNISIDNMNNNDMVSDKCNNIFDDIINNNITMTGGYRTKKYKLFK